MEYFLIFFILLLSIIIYGFIKRKQVFSKVKEFERWKIKIMNKPVTDEIAKVKNLNMTGQTERKFEEWRASWDEIITTELPAIDDLLFDVEESANRFRFKKANKINIQIRSKLEKIEQKIATILAELQELIGSEEKNKLEIEELKGIMKEHRKQLLASRHIFGSAIIQLEKELEDIAEKFTIFEQSTEGGNYLEASEIVGNIRKELDNLSEKLDEIPKLLSCCHGEFPTQIQELRKGYQEMLTDGYVIDHLGIPKALDKIEADVKTHLRNIEQTDIHTAKEGIADIKDRIENIYDCLEKEAIAKQIVKMETPILKPRIIELQEKVDFTKKESKSIQEIYHLKEKDFEDQRNIEKRVSQISTKYHELVKKIEENSEPASKLREDLEELKEKIESTNELHAQYMEMIHTLRKDELEAKEKIQEMKKRLVEAKILIRKNHLPGIPEHVKQSFATAESNVKAVFYKLEETPLDMYAVHLLLEEAQEAVQKVYDQTEDIVEKVILIEKLIQYGNRYRGKYPILSAKLSEAEHIFRMYDYDLALEQAATAIEEVEPGALQKIHEFVKTTTM